MSGSDSNSNSSGNGSSSKDNSKEPCESHITLPLIDEDSVKEYDEGVASTIFRARIITRISPSRDEKVQVQEEDKWVAIKSASAKKRFSPEPHDIMKEIAVLSNVSHVNIIDILGWRRDSTYDTIELWTPWLPYNLESLLDSPSFTPTPYPPHTSHLIFPSNETSPSRPSIFTVLTRSIMYQLAHALTYLHSQTPTIAHRDIKPRNILIDHTGLVKLIDFGIAYSAYSSNISQNLWPEPPDKMYSDVATGPFRAPELIFGPTTYDACATDLWSLGATLAHFFTPINLTKKSNSFDSDSDSDPHSGYTDDDDSQSKKNVNPKPPSGGYVLPKDAKSVSFRSAEWTRTPLFDAQLGSIGLAWSIFRLRGTPNKENWPEFETLPDALKVEFLTTPAVSLKAYLPNLPATGASHSTSASPVDIIHRLLVYSPSRRLSAKEVCDHPWISCSSPSSSPVSDSEDKTNGNVDEPLLLPKCYKTSGDKPCRTTWNDKDLSHWLKFAYNGMR